MLEDNKLKLDIVSKLNKVRSTIEGLELDDSTKLDLIQSTSSVSSSIKQSYEKTKSHVKIVNSSANKTEEAFERIDKKSKKTDVGVAHMLFDMQTNGPLEP